MEFIIDVLYRNNHATSDIVTGLYLPIALAKVYQECLDKDTIEMITVTPIS